MIERDRFGAIARAGGVEDDDRIGGTCAFAGHQAWQALALAIAGIGLKALAWGRVDEDDFLQSPMGGAGAQCCNVLGKDAFAEARNGEQQSHLRVAQKEIQLPCRRPSAERDNDGPDRRSGEEDFEPFYAVVAKQSDSDTAPDPGPTQALRHSPRPGLERCIGDAGIDRGCKGPFRDGRGLLAEQLEHCAAERRLHMLSGAEPETPHNNNPADAASTCGWPRPTDERIPTQETSVTLQVKEAAHHVALITIDFEL